MHNYVDGVTLVFSDFLLIIELSSIFQKMSVNFVFPEMNKNSSLKDIFIK